jgi:hypothetical protein
VAEVGQRRHIYDQAAIHQEIEYVVTVGVPRGGASATSMELTVTLPREGGADLVEVPDLAAVAITSTGSHVSGVVVSTS